MPEEGAGGLWLVPRFAFTALAAALAIAGCVPPIEPPPELPPIAHCGPQQGKTETETSLEQTAHDPTAWSHSFMAWVAAHKTYPEYARLRLQQGSPSVRFHIARDGHVSRLCLLAASKFPVLDVAVFKLFEGARLPPPPPLALHDELTLTFTMDYILK